LMIAVEMDVSVEVTVTVLAGDEVVLDDVDLLVVVLGVLDVVVVVVAVVVVLVELVVLVVDVEVEEPESTVKNTIAVFLPSVAETSC